jgi:plasmid maintenance system antidote protein VapI
MSISEAAKRMKVSRQMLHKILAEKAPIAPDMAVRIGAPDAAGC